MIFEYDKEYQTLKFISGSGMVQSVHVPESDLEKLYHLIWYTMQDQVQEDCDAMKYSLHQGLTSESLGV